MYFDASNRKCTVIPEAWFTFRYQELELHKLRYEGLDLLSGIRSHITLQLGLHCDNNLIKNDAKCSLEIKCRIAIAKAAFNKKKVAFTKKKNVWENYKVELFEHGFLWC